MEQITGLKTSDYYFDLPQELIAQDPLEDRASSRLLVMDKETGKIEHRVFSDIKELLKRISADRWETLVRPGKKLKPGARITFGDGSLKAVILDILDEGNRLVEFEYEGIFEEVLDRLGEMPLPPYITHKLKDRKQIPDGIRKVRGKRRRAYRGTSFH